MLSEAYLEDLIRVWVANNTQQHLPRMPALQDSTDLIASGWLDSMGFVELLVYIQSVIGKEIDLSDLDPLEFSSIRGLVQGLVRAS
jgi:acyl carrier protein